MGVSERGRLPVDLARGRSRFQAWRARRQPGSRIPQAFWTLAVGLAKLHGVARAATVLGLDYYSLQKRVQSAVEPATSSAFVELPPSMTLDKQCVFELADGAGATMRVQLVGYDVADLGTLSRSFWKAL
ncbi:MAG TPA: hypothetical protein VHZ24_07500 [Pirellulales bacterium]|nr:hypothetical protein [Pirellulales bacterium]